MNEKPIELYIISGITGIVGSLLMLASSGLVLFKIQSAYLAETAQQKLDFIANTPLVGITHGLGVVSLLLIVPTVIAIFILLKDVATSRSLFGLGFALLWIVLEMLGHLTQTAPLRPLSELYKDPQTREMAVLIFRVSEELWEAFTLTGTFAAVLMSLCYGLVLIGGKNKPSGVLLLLACIAFPIGMAVPRLGVELHVILRGVAFIIISGVLIQVATAEED
jgi:hypothetical protein